MNLSDPSLYRVSICDDGNYGTHHTSVRIKPVARLTIEEFNECSDKPNYGFISVEEDK